MDENGHNIIPDFSSGPERGDGRGGRCDEEMSLFFELDPDLFCILAPDGTFRKMNKAWESATHFSAGELTGKNISHFIHPEDFALTREALSHLSSAEVPVKFSTRCQCKDGSWIHLEWIGKKSADGKAIYAVARDISDRIRMEEQLRQKESIHQTITASARDGIIMLDYDGNISFWNDAASNILGYAREETIGKNLHELLAPERFHAAHQKAFLQFQFSGQGSAVGQTLELSAIHKSGKEIPIELSLSSVKINSRWCSVGIVRDITDRKIAEAKVLRERILLRTLIDNLPDSIFVKDKEGRKILANPADVAIMGCVTEAAAIGKTDLEIFQEETAKHGYEEDMQVLRTEQPIIDLEGYFIDKDGKGSWILTTKVPLYDEQGKISGLVGIGHNITHRKEAELKLIQLTEELKEINATKDKLFSIIAHDLRGPIGNLSQGLELLFSDRDLSEDTKKNLLEELVNASQTTFSLLENLLNWSRSQTNTIVIQPGFFFLNESIAENVSLLLPNARQKSIEIKVEAEKDQEVFADKNSINLILRNLLTNAIKFTATGGSIAVSTCDKGVFIELAVTDTGVGMSQEVLDNLFKSRSFYSTFGTDGEKGSGIGLVLCKDFAERNGGEIRAESAPGQGSRFIITIPKF